MLKKYILKQFAWILIFMRMVYCEQIPDAVYRKNIKIRARRSLFKKYAENRIELLHNSFLLKRHSFVLCFPSIFSSACLDTTRPLTEWADALLRPVSRSGAGSLDKRRKRYSVSIIQNSALWSKIELYNKSFK